MAPLTLLGIAVGLAMDAFAVALGVGLTLATVTRRQAFRLAWHFGLFQFLMPVLGWLAGRTVERQIAAVDHWIAFALLAGIGGKMLYESGRDGAEARAAGDPTRGWSLLVLSVATSVDALAVGLSLGLLRVRIWYPAAVIGVVAALLTAAGLRLGKRLGAIFGRRMEALGGVVLLAIGVKILLEHLRAG
jgi:putative Mn2+ efflux pump MntP